MVALGSRPFAPEVKNSAVPVGADDELILRIGFCGVASGGEGNDDFDLRACGSEDTIVLDGGAGDCHIEHGRSQLTRGVS